LHTVFAVLFPVTTCLDVFACVDFGGVTEHGDGIAPATDLDTKHAETGFGGMEGNALD
jgi:hypothetical protein